MPIPITDGLRLKVSYRKWCSMRRRCYDKKAENYPYYGGRGIKVCDRWLGREGYANFIKDMGEPPEGLWLDRKDNDEDYTPDNCKWSTPKQQVNNRRPKTCNPESLNQKAKAAGLPYMLVYLRIHTLGWSEEKALSTPKMGKGVKRGPKKTRAVVAQSTQPTPQEALACA